MLTEYSKHTGNRCPVLPTVAVAYRLGDGIDRVAQAGELAWGRALATTAKGGSLSTEHCSTLRRATATDDDSRSAPACGLHPIAAGVVTSGGRTTLPTLNESSRLTTGGPDDAN